MNETEDLEFDEIRLKKSDDKRIGGTVTLQKTLPDSTVNRFLNYRKPILTDQGILLVADARLEDPRSLLEEYAIPPQPPDLRQEVDSLREMLRPHIENFKPIISKGEEFALWLRSSALLSISKDVSKFPDSKRTATVRSISSTGEIAALKGNDKNIGDFGIYAKLSRNGGLRGNVLIGGLTAASDDRGINLAGAIMAHAQADIQFQLKTPLTPAISYDAHFETTGNTTVSGLFSVFTKSAQSHPAAYWGFDFNCSIANLSVETQGGKLFGALPVSFEKITLELPLRLFEKKGKASLLMSGFPQRKPMKPPAKNDDDRRKEAEKSFALVTPAVSLDTAILPIDAQITRDGYRLIPFPYQIDLAM